MHYRTSRDIYSTDFSNSCRLQYKNSLFSELDNLVSHINLCWSAFHLSWLLGHRTPSIRFVDRMIKQSWVGLRSVIVSTNKYRNRGSHLESRGKWCKCLMEQQHKAEWETVSYDTLDNMCVYFVTTCWSLSDFDAMALVDDKQKVKATTHETTQIKSIMLVNVWITTRSVAHLH